MDPSFAALTGKVTRSHGLCEGGTLVPRGMSTFVSFLSYGRLGCSKQALSQRQTFTLYLPGGFPKKNVGTKPDNGKENGTDGMFRSSEESEE